MSVLIAVTLLDEPNRLNVVIDLTEQKRSEKAIRSLRGQHEADTRFRALLEAAPDAMVIADPDGAIVFINAQAERLFGYAREELFGKSVDILFPERFRGAHPDHRKRYSAEPTVRAVESCCELFARRKDGREFPVEVSLGPLQTKDGVLVSSAIRAITERKAAELEQRARGFQRLRRSRFASSASSHQWLQQGCRDWR